MMRYVVAFLIALYAIGFAFLALASVRWPSLLTLAALFGEHAGALGEIKAVLNWRELGLTHGLAYLVTALCFYCSSTLIGRGRRSAILFYVVALGTGFLPLMLFDFEPGWWQTPDTFQQIVILAASIAVFLFSFILELSGKKSSSPKRVADAEPKAEPAMDPAMIPEPAIAPLPLRVQPKKALRRRPVPAAIARQRASFAAHGRRAKRRNMR